MPTSKFSELYQKLNPEQKQAVDEIEGPVMVVAGPGTGKTYVLTLRIANILRETDTRPENILVLTFTESAAAAMRRRLVEIIASPAYQVEINTFHGFCNEIIKSYPEEFSEVISRQNITEVDQINIIESIVESQPLRELKPLGDAFYYIKEIKANLDQLKREGIEPERFDQFVQKDLDQFEAIDDLYYGQGRYQGQMKGEYQKVFKQIKRNQELAKVYHQYQSELDQSKFYDYNDMIMTVRRELSANPDLLLILQEQSQYILVDEHQDTNNAQNKILERLAGFHKNPNIFVVGDEKQAIFRFQGASLENFIYFKKIYPKAKLIVLNKNYRSTQTILDSAQSLIASPKKLQSVQNETNLKKRSLIKLYGLSRPELEIYFVARDIKTKIEVGIKPKEIAVLFRDNKDIMPFTPMFEKIGLPFSIESDQDILTDPEIKKFILILKAIDQFNSTEKVVEAMHVDFLNLPILDLYKILTLGLKNKIEIFDLLCSKKLLDQLNLDSSQAFFDFYQKLSTWKSAAKNKSLPEFFEIIVRESGFLTYLLRQPDAIEKMEKLMVLFDQIKELTTKHKDYDLNDFLQYLELIQSQKLLIKKTSNPSLTDKIRLMTAHRAKGQEFEVVYIINAVAGHWGSRRRSRLIQLPSSVFSPFGLSLENISADDDERRLFYVALTRAKKDIIITYSKENIIKQEQLPTQFIQEIKSSLIETMPTTEIEEEFKKNKEVIFAPKLIIVTGLKDKEFIRSLFLERGLSPTGLNNYLKCPWNYFYVNLLRLPKAKTKNQIYGTAIHNALMIFFRQLSKQARTNLIKLNSGQNFSKDKIDKKFLLAKFKDYLKKEPINQSDFERLKEKGEKALSGYFQTYADSWPTDVLTEFKIKDVLVGSEIKLIGQIDKIEFITKNDRTVNVVDYKTSQPKTRAEIEGLTKNSNGEIKRQLIFYNLLLNQYEQGRRFKMASAEIDFIEPNQKGRYRKEKFLIEPVEIKELEELIKKTADGILNFSFFDQSCGDQTCQFCQLREAMA